MCWPSQLTQERIYSECGVVWSQAKLVGNIPAVNVLWWVINMIAKGSYK